MSNNDEEFERVHEKIKAAIMDFHEIHRGAQFHVEQLRRFVLQQIPAIAPDSPGRILRALRQEGRLDYVILNRRASLYQFKEQTPPPSVDEQGQYWLW